MDITLTPKDEKLINFYISLNKVVGFRNGTKTVNLTLPDTRKLTIHKSYDNFGIKIDNDNYSCYLNTNKDDVYEKEIRKGVFDKVYGHHVDETYSIYVSNQQIKNYFKKFFSGKKEVLSKEAWLAQYTFIPAWVSLSFQNIETRLPYAIYTNNIKNVLDKYANDQDDKTLEILISVLQGV